MQSGPCAGMIDSGAGQSGLAVRARRAGAGQDQVVDELALSDLIYGRSINQDFFAAAPRGRCRLFLLPLQFMFDGAGGAGDDDHCDKEARGGHLAVVRCSLRLHGTRTSSRSKFYRDMARERRGQSAAATRYVQRGPRAGV